MQAAPPAATGNAGSQFEAKVGAFYLLSLLAGGEPRGLPGATIRNVAFQQRGSGRPLDDVVVEAANADGSDALLELQAKRTLTFTASDKEFKAVVAQIWEAAQKPEFETSRYELAVAIARTTTRVEHVCQETLHWARQLPSGTAFAEHIARKNFASDGMRGFVEVFRANLTAANAPTDDETVWRLLRRFQILAFDFESPGSDFEHRARERARFALAPAQANRAAELWPVLIDYVAACVRAGGSRDRAATVQALQTEYGFRFETRADLRSVRDRLKEAADHALAEIKDNVGGVRLSRTGLIAQAQAELEQHRIVHIVGSAGVGKSWVMKALAEGVTIEGRILVLRNGRIVPGGWMQMAHVIGCPVTRDELFNELGCGGGATLFIDNIDQIADAAEWATVTDLLLGVAKNPGWRAVVTGGVGNEDWKTNLPPAVQNAGIASLTVDPISDEETEVLSEGNSALGIILGNDHPAHGIARNLFYLSRMIELGAGKTDATIGIASETDLARLWWRYGGGRTEDDDRFARLKVLRAMGSQVLVSPSRVAFKIDDLDSSTVAALLRFDSLREDTKGATVAFRHDVLRDWTIGFFIHDDGDQIAKLPMDRPIPAGLARGLEVAARLALDADNTGERWSALLAVVERDGAHGSWMRPVLLALPRAEKALTLFGNLSPLLLTDDGRRLGEVIRVMIAIESEPIAKLVARLQPSISVPSGAGDLIVPRGIGWVWLVMWLVTNGKSLPSARIPDVTKAFQAWLMSTQNQGYPFNAQIVGYLFDWLALIEDNMSYRMVRKIEDAPPNLKIPHMRDVRDELRMTAFSFAHLSPADAQKYVSGLDPDEVRHHEMQAILKAPGSLARAAPAALATFALNALIEKDDPDDMYGGRHDRHGPFGVNDHLLSPASPSQGPFLELLNASPADGLRLVRGLVEHATEWRREMYARDRVPFPRVSVPFPGGTKSFEGDQSVYNWSRSIMPSVITASALMALEAWGHSQIEAGRPFEQVLHDVLGPDGSSIAFVLVAVDLVLSHWEKARDVAWPLMAAPEILQFDDARSVRDIAGVDRIALFEQEPGGWPVKRADLEVRASRRAQLSSNIGHYPLQGDPKQLEALRTSLMQALNEIGQTPRGGEDPIHGLHATAKRAVRMTYAENWPKRSITLSDGRDIEVHQYERDPEEAARFAAGASRAEARTRHLNVRLKIQAALFDPSKSTPEIVAEGLAWAVALPSNGEPVQAEEEDDQEGFNRQWDRRAVAMMASLVARDYTRADRKDVIDWALPVLQTAASKDEDDHGNGQIQYTMAAIAAVGLIALYRRDRTTAIRDALLHLASKQHLAVINSLGGFFPELAQLDPRLPRALVRLVMASSIHPHRGETERQTNARRKIYRENIARAVVAEKHWLNEAGNEPPWPELPPWLSRPRRGIRIGGGIDSDEEDEVTENPDQYVNEHVLGPLVGHLVRMTVGAMPAWIIDLAAHLMRWTDQANGPHDANARERDNRPYTWNGNFFEFAGILSVAVPHSEAVKLFLDPITRFKDEPFHDVMATFLRGFDRAMRATDTKKPENPVAVRALLGDRIQKGRNYQRYQREKTFNSETHAGDAMTAMFFQPHRFGGGSGGPSVPNNWDGLDALMPTLTALVVGAPSSGYLATLFLNLVETSSRASLMPFVVAAMSAWCSAYGVDTNFWSEKEMGARACAWLDRTLAADASAAERPGLVDGLMKCLDILVRSGVAQAREVEERIAGPGRDRKSA